jgi:two-component system, NarL family, nitrate/nitrite response regulator NarL
MRHAFCYLHGSSPLVVTHSCTLLHDGLRQIFKKSAFGPVRVVSTLDAETEAYILGQENCVWLVGIEKDSSSTNGLVRRVTARNPGVKAVVLAADQRASDIVAALQAGACGYLCQDISAERLIKSLELIAHHQMVVYAHCRASGDERKDISTQEVLRSDPQLSLPSDSELSSGRFSTEEGEPKGQVGSVARGLTRREMLILHSLMEGASNKVIALKLVMTESTVKVHMKAILRKLRLQNRTQAAIWARDHANELRDARDSLEQRTPGVKIDWTMRAPVDEARSTCVAA